MRRRNIVIGQRIQTGKKERARQFRREATPEEELLWNHLRRNQLGGLHFRRQQIIDGFIVDFYCHSAGMVVEVDGPVHQEQAGYDAARDARLGERGLRVLRVTNDEVQQEMEEVLRRIGRACGVGT